MIELTKLNGKKFVVNAELIETIETTPDTVLTLTSGKKLVVNEKKAEIVKKVIEYKRKILVINNID
ncbi:MAG TPA: flagellar FlbD family protein [Thermoanaerobacterales bacterium]|jgi:flagellar protein FlbD|nr:flagellar FlbD family protein [Thermoanaerobacterales bacterium]